MDYEKIFSYLCETVVSGKVNVENFYNEIVEFQNVHFIPSVPLETALFLNWIANLTKPESVLEIGFGGGVSTLFINRDLKKVKDFVTFEWDRNRYKRGLDLFKHFGITNIDLHHANALKYLPGYFAEWDEKFDFIFLDAIKREYYQYLPILKKLLSRRGVLICDNILFGGKVVEDTLEKKYENGVKLLKRFNDMVCNDEDLNTVLIPVGDGLSLSFRKY